MVKSLCHYPGLVMAIAITVQYPASDGASR